MLGRRLNEKKKVKEKRRNMSQSGVSILEIRCARPRGKKENGREEGGGANEMAHGECAEQK